MGKKIHRCKKKPGQKTVRGVGKERINLKSAFLSPNSKWRVTKSKGRCVELTLNKKLKRKRKR